MSKANWGVVFETFKCMSPVLTCVWCQLLLGQTNYCQMCNLASTTNLPNIKGCDCCCSSLNTYVNLKIGFPLLYWQLTFLKAWKGQVSSWGGQLGHDFNINCDFVSAQPQTIYKQAKHFENLKCKTPRPRAFLTISPLLSVQGQCFHNRMLFTHV